MEGQRRALFGTWAFLLTFHAVVHSSTGKDAGQVVDIRTVLSILNGETFYGQDTTSDTTPSLLGIHAYCLKMKFLQTGNTGLPNTLSLFYIDSSNKLKSSYWTNATLSIKVAESENSVTFTFTRANKTELMGRNVKYVLLKTLNNQDYSFCSILQTSKGQPNCSYWVLVMSRGGVVPEWCLPDTIEQGCKVEIYTLTKHKECGYTSEEEEDDDDDDYEEDDYEESDYEEDEDDEDEYGEDDDEEDEDTD